MSVTSVPEMSAELEQIIRLADAAAGGGEEVRATDLVIRSARLEAAILGCSEDTIGSGIAKLQIALRNARQDWPVGADQNWDMVASALDDLEAAAECSVGILTAVAA